MTHFKLGKLIFLHVRGWTEHAIWQQIVAYLENAQEGRVLINKENTSSPESQTISREIPIPKGSNQKRLNSPSHRINLTLGGKK